MWRPNTGRCPSGMVGMLCSAPDMEHRPEDKEGTPRDPPSPAEPQGRLMPALGTGDPLGTYATEHWAKARYSSSTSSPLFSSLRNSWTQLEGAEGQWALPAPTSSLPLCPDTQQSWNRGP